MITAPPTYWIRENETRVEKRENIQHFTPPPLTQFLNTRLTSTTATLRLNLNALIKNVFPDNISRGNQSLR